MTVRIRAANRLITVATAISLTIMLGAGCHDPNNPNINPKARHALAWQAMDDLLQPFNSYQLKVIRQLNPQTNRRETLYRFIRESDKPIPESFVLLYDPAERRMCLQTSLDSLEDLETLPHARAKSDVGIQGDQR